jgi:hypothetical protein
MICEKEVTYAELVTLFSNLVIPGNKIRNDFIYRPVLHRAAFLPVCSLFHKIVPRMWELSRQHEEDCTASDRKEMWLETVA